MNHDNPPGRISPQLWQDKDFRRWYASCPPEVRHLAALYPYGTRYLIKGGARIGICRTAT